MTKEDQELKSLAERVQGRPYAMDVERVDALCVGVLRLLAQEEAREEHFCIACHHRWSGESMPAVTEYCGDCHRQFQVMKARFEERAREALEGPWMCHECGHEHTGRRLGYICIGCRCQSKPKRGA